MRVFFRQTMRQGVFAKGSDFCFTLFIGRDGKVNVVGGDRVNFAFLNKNVVVVFIVLKYNNFTLETDPFFFDGYAAAAHGNFGDGI